MNLLLDTHVWLWSLLEPQLLSARVADALADEANEIWLSPITPWEVLILAERGRIALDPDPAVWIETALAAAPLREAPITDRKSVV
jgi:PIN domain nuclease of toxin-antitoxin system